MALYHGRGLFVGTGPGGRIVKEDVLAAASGPQAATHDMDDEIIPFTPMRTRIAERLSRSKQTIPHFYLFAEADMTEAFQQRFKFNDQHGTKVTINAFDTRQTGVTSD